MILKSYDLKNHIKKKINIYLLYGENSDLIDEVIEKNLKPLLLKITIITKNQKYY